MSLCAEHYEEAYTTISNKDLRRLLAIEGAAEALTDPPHYGSIDTQTVWLDIEVLRELKKAVEMYD